MLPGMGVETGDATRVGPLDKLSVVLVPVFGAFFLREHLSVPNWFGVAFIAAGAMLVVYRARPLSSL
jgi:bacterial/archaeal transporter family protein